LPRAFVRMLRDSIRYRGVVKTARYLASEAREMLLDALPERKRSRFGDIDYDCDFGVDTTWARLPLSVRLRELTTERLYQPTEPGEFRELMAKVLIDYADFVFIDLGSGKGRALLLASEYPFREVIGVEIQPELHAIAEQNILRFHPAERKCEHIESVCMDAREFKFPPEPLLLYLFNPFPEYVFERVLANLKRSLQEHPRPAFIVYNTPLAKDAIEGQAFLQKLRETDRYQIYRAQTTARPK
jgi:SAM-dependent methyltransferase